MKNEQVILLAGFPALCTFLPFCLFLLDFLNDFIVAFSFSGSFRILFTPFLKFFALFILL